MINRYKYLLPARHRRPKPDAVGDDDTNDDDEDPGPDPDDDYSWRDDLDLPNRPESPNFDLDAEPEHNQDDILTDVEDIVDMEDIDYYVHVEDHTINTNQNRFGRDDDRSASPSFILHSRHNSPEITTSTTHDTIDDDDLEMDIYPANIDLDLNDDRDMTFQSPKQPKLEPKVEPGSEVTTTIENTRFRSMNNFIDLTAELDTTDESVRSGSRNMEVIDLTEVEDPVVNRNSSGIELIELED